MKVKYTWTLMHGDADHYDKESLTLTDENDIAFFDYIIELEFNSFDCEGIVFAEDMYDEEELKEEELEPQRPKLIELLRNTTYYKKWIEILKKEINLNDNSTLKDYLSDILREWNYVKSDATTGGWHYASIENVQRKEIKDKPKKSKVYVVYTNELRCDIVKIFKNKNKARKFIEEGNGKYLEIIDEYNLE